MNVYICQNYMYGKNGNADYQFRAREELDKELEEIKALCKKVYKGKEITFFTPDRNLLNKMAPQEELAKMGFDLGVVLSTFTEEDRIIFSKEFYFDPFCNSIKYVSELYGIKNTNAVILERKDILNF